MQVLFLFFFATFRLVLKHDNSRPHILDRLKIISIMGLNIMAENLTTFNFSWVVHVRTPLPPHNQNHDHLVVTQFDLLSTIRHLC